MTGQGRAWMVALVAVAGCGGPEGVQLARSTPPYGPVVGGTRITLAGSGFGAASNRVLIGGREAPLVATIDDETLELVIPPGEHPGDAEVVVLNDHGTARATGLFRYSAPPTITAVAPADVLYRSFATTITVTGTGFADEGAGEVTVAVDGQPVFDVEVQGDTTLTFTAPPGRPLLQPDLEVVDGRGRASRRRGFRYVPSLRPGLLLFPAAEPFAVFFDPTDNSVVNVPWVASPSVRLTAVVRDLGGDYWGLDRARRFGRLDLRTQRLEGTTQGQGRFPTVIRVGGDLLALERNSLRFGRLEPATGQFVPIGTASLPCCGSYGLAHDSATGTLVFTARQDTALTINTIDPLTGELGTPVPLVGEPSLHVEEMRFFAGTLYASSRDGTLVTIDPATGVTTILPVPIGRVHAMELFEPTPAP